MADKYVNLCSFETKRRLILTSPKADKFAEAKSILDKNGLEYDVIDIANVGDIGDEDLAFLLRNQHMHFWETGNPAYSYAPSHFPKSLREFRSLLAEGHVFGNRSHIINDGQMEAYFDWRQKGWVRSGVEPQIWSASKL